jgi:membrane protein implicated in regulation of membrane protease activity
MDATSLLHIWWVWLSAALALALIELVLPTSIFLGFSLGALVMAGVVAFTAITNTSALLALFAALSLVAWIALKIAFKSQSSGARVVTRDINEN